MKKEKMKNEKRMNRAFRSMKNEQMKMVINQIDQIKQSKKNVMM